MRDQPPLLATQSATPMPHGTEQLLGSRETLLGCAMELVCCAHICKGDALVIVTAARRLPEHRAIEHGRCVCSPIRICHVRRDHPLHVHIVQRLHMLAVTFLLPLSVVAAAG